MNAAVIRKWWWLFRESLAQDDPRYKLTEVRILGKKGGKKMTASGYFTDVETLIEAIAPYDGYGIYAPVNVLHNGCYSRDQRDHIVEGSVTTTSKEDIRGIAYIFIDFDPERPSDTNATDEELALARAKMLQVGCFLRDQGFSSPVVIMSGNGYHCYYKVHLENNDRDIAMIKDFMAVLDMLFSDENVKIDLQVTDPNRIAKIPGTRSAKGANTQERPQRESFFVKIPEDFEQTGRAYIEKVAAMLPKPEAPSMYNNFGRDRFDLRSFMSEHGIKVAKEAAFKGGTKFILEECPFCSEHKAPDSAIFLTAAGAIGFKCLHNSCAQYSWRDVRLRFDPEAYSRRDYDEFTSRRNMQAEKPAPVIAPENKEKGKKWLAMSDIIYQDPLKAVHIPTGFTVIDKEIGGLALGDVTILSGYPGSGKTSLINCVALNAIQKGFKVAVWSGELQDFRFQSWIDQTAAGKQFVRKYQSWWFTPQDVCKTINEWLTGKLFLYNNEYGNKFSQIFADIKECIEQNNTQLIVLDNLTALSLDSFTGERNDRQSAFVNDIKELAKKANIHILLVVHPRKEIGNAFLRRESISGTADLANLVDNILIAHRVGKDFEVRAKPFFGVNRCEELLQFQEVLEIAKNRSLGKQDITLGLYFEPESRRFKNEIAEHVVYDWQDPPQTSITFNDTDDFGELPSDFGTNEEYDDLPI